MGKIDSKKKWDLEKKLWITPNRKTLKKSFAIANFPPIKTNSSNQFEYIIICEGVRVENCSLTGNKTNEKCGKIDIVKKQFENYNQNIIIQKILNDNDAPLSIQGALLASYINQISQKQSTSTINILSHSKCAVMCFDMIKHLNQISLSKTNLYTSSTPFQGTPLASSTILFPKLEKALNENMTKIISKTLLEIIKQIYPLISSNSHMDYDIALPGSIPKQLENLYDPSLIENIFSKDNINAIQKLNNYYNVYTKIDAETLKQSLKEKNLAGIGLYILDELLFDENSDGFVTITSQSSVERHLDTNKIHLPASHHGIFTSDTLIKTYIDQVKDNINEEKEKRLYKKIN